MTAAHNKQTGYITGLSTRPHIVEDEAKQKTARIGHENTPRRHHLYFPDAATSTNHRDAVFTGHNRPRQKKTRIHLANRHLSLSVVLLSEHLALLSVMPLLQGKLCE